MEQKSEYDSKVALPSGDEEKMALMADFSLRANPHVKFTISDITSDWGRLAKQEMAQLEDLLARSGLFITFEKKGSRRFMLKDSARAGLIAAGSYAEFIAGRKEGMSEEDLAMANLRDEEDNIRKADEDSRMRKKSTDKAILIIGVAILIALIIIVKLLLDKIAKP